MRPQVRKSFDARRGKPKRWAYVVDCDAAAAAEAGATEVEPKQGILEWCVWAGKGGAWELLGMRAGAGYWSRVS